jgi:hypothetical protein
VDSLPEVAFVPDHEPDASHVVAFVLDHVSIAAPPSSTLLTEEESETVGALAGGGVVGGGVVGGGVVGGGVVAAFTVTSALAEVLPPEPVQAST